MKKYEVRLGSVETKDGRNALDVFFSKGNQDTDLYASCDSLEEAVDIYNDIPTSCGYRRNGNTVYYLHDFKVIEESEYDKDGKFVESYGWAECDIPEREDN